MAGIVTKATGPPHPPLPLLLLLFFLLFLLLLLLDSHPVLLLHPFSYLQMCEPVPAHCESRCKGHGESRCKGHEKRFGVNGPFLF